MLLLEKIKEAEATLSQLQDREVLKQDDFKITKTEGEGTKEETDAATDLLKVEVMRKEK